MRMREPLTKAGIHRHEPVGRPMFSGVAGLLLLLLPLLLLLLLPLLLDQFAAACEAYRAKVSRA